MLEMFLPIVTTYLWMGWYDVLDWLAMCDYDRV